MQCWDLSYCITGLWFFQPRSSVKDCWYLKHHPNWFYMTPNISFWVIPQKTVTINDQLWCIGKDSSSSTKAEFRTSDIKTLKWMVCTKTLGKWICSEVISKQLCNRKPFTILKWSSELHVHSYNFEINEIAHWENWGVSVHIIMDTSRWLGNAM